MAGFGNNSSGRFAKSSKERDVNTTGFILRNEKAGKFLKVDYFNRCITFTIGIAPAGQPLDYQTIRNATSISQTLVFSQMFNLREICDDISTSIKETGTFTSTGTDAGANDDCCVEISNGSNIDEKPGIYLVIYKDIDKNTGRTNNCEYYPFGTGKFYRDYNHRTGQRQIDVGKSGQFKIIREAISEACAAFTMAQAHAVQEAGKFEKLQTYKALSAMAASMGVDLTQDLKFETKKTGSTGGWNRGQKDGGYQKKSGGWSQFNNGNGQSSNGYRNRSGVFENSGKPSYSNYQQSPADDSIDVNLDMESLSNVSFGSFN